MKALLLTLCLLLNLVGLATAQTQSAEAPLTIAIWPFDIVTVGSPVSPEDLNLLREVVPDLLAAEVSVLPRVRLIERQRLGDVLKEQQLGASDLADDATRLRLGRLVGARWMVFGSQLRIGNTWQLDARLVDVETSRIATTFSESGQHSDYLGLTRRMASQLLKTVQ